MQQPLVLKYKPVRDVLTYIQFYFHQEFLLLQIDVPKANEQGPLAVENIFSHLAGAHSTFSFYENWWVGRCQLPLSLEIISVGGYIKFIIRTPVKYRDLVEASVYSQYPDAQITEVQDYVGSVPKQYPNPTHLLWGAEWIPVNHEVYPIRTYKEFEDKLSGEFKDPLSAILEDFARISEGEQAWYQILVIPIGQKEWPEAGTTVINKLIGRKEEHKTSWVSTLLGLPLQFLTLLVDIISPPSSEGAPHKAEEEDFEKSKMLFMPPHEKNIVEAIGKKISKIGFEVKIRFIYVARKEIYYPPRVVNGFVGGIKQFNTVDLNSLKPATKFWTSIPPPWDFRSIRLNLRRQQILRAYRGRSDGRGARHPFVLNTEELATLWHFPMMQVKAPLVKKSESKKAEPPFSLPVVE